MRVPVSVIAPMGILTALVIFSYKLLFVVPQAWIRKLRVYDTFSFSTENKNNELYKLQRQGKIIIRISMKLERSIEK